MPELPEVETTLRGLRPVLANATIQKVVVRKENLRIPIPKEFGKTLAGRYVSGLHRRGKYLLIDLKGGDTVIVHLGMSGSFTIAESKMPLDTHDHVVFELSHGKSIRFNDPRRFGLMTLARFEELADHPLLCHLGPEPLLSDAFDAAYLMEHLKSRKSTIKQALMDNAVVVGIGNIYASEILFRAGVRPNRSCKTIDTETAKIIVEKVREVLTEAIAAGGSSLKDFKHGEQQLGYFQHNFKVYNRAGEACTAPGCAAKIEKTIIGGRSTYFCPSCQK